MALWFKRWSAFDSARSLVDWLAWPFLAFFGTSVSAVIAAAAAYTQWYWEAYGPIGVAFAFLASIVALSLCALIAGGAILMVSIAKRSLTGQSVKSTNLEDVPLATPDAFQSDITQKLAFIDERIDLVNNLASEAHKGISNRIDKLEPHIVKDIDSYLRELRNDLTRVISATKKLQDDTYETLRARAAEYDLDICLTKIRPISEELYQPTLNPGVPVDWGKWDHAYREWLTRLRSICMIARPYADVEKAIFTIDPADYRSSTWTFDKSIFPNDDQLMEYKDFCIRKRNLEDFTPKIREAVLSASRV